MANHMANDPRPRMASQVQGQWNYPAYWPQPTWTHSQPGVEYANEIEIDRNEHDAVIRFYRAGQTKNASKTARHLVREITVPLGALEGLA